MSGTYASIGVYTPINHNIDFDHIATMIKPVKRDLQYNTIHNTPVTGERYVPDRTRVTPNTIVDIMSNDTYRVYKSAPLKEVRELIKLHGAH